MKNDKDYLELKNNQLQNETKIVSLYNFEYWQERLSNCSNVIKINSK